MKDELTCGVCYWAKLGGDAVICFNRLSVHGGCKMSLDSSCEQARKRTGLTEEYMLGWQHGYNHGFHIGRNGMPSPEEARAAYCKAVEREVKEYLKRKDARKPDDKEKEEKP